MAKQIELEMRLKMNELAQAGQTDKEIAQVLECSQWTVGKWRRRDRAEGRLGLKSTIGRPVTGSLSTYPAEMRSTLLVWRQHHPGWGAKTLRTELQNDDRFKAQRIPSLRSLNRFLSAQALVEPHQQHSNLPQPTPQRVRSPHEEWEIDARGHEYIATWGSWN